MRALFVGGLLLCGVPAFGQGLQVNCDLNGDGVCSPVDANRLVDLSAQGLTDVAFDLDEDGNVDVDDLGLYLSSYVNRLNGDVDFSGSIEFADFLSLSDNFGNAADWRGGDLDADGVVGFPDFLILSDNFGKSSPSMEMDVAVNVSEANGLFTYEYTVTNLATSPMPLNTLFIDVAAGGDVIVGNDIALGIRSLESPVNWVGEYQPYELVPTRTAILRDEVGNPVPFAFEEISFVAGNGQSCEAAGLLPGASETFTLESEYGPGDGFFFAGNLTNPCGFFTSTAFGDVLAPMVPPAAGAASVPEPNACFLICFAFAGLQLFRQECRRNT